MTLKLCVFTRHYTWVNFVCLSALSVALYYIFVWVCNNLSISKTEGTIVMLHKSPLFYLTVLLLIGLTFMVDLFITGFKFNFCQSPSDFLREKVNKKKNINKYHSEFDKIYAKIKTHYVEEDIKREAYLDHRREELAKMLN